VITFLIYEDPPSFGLPSLGLENQLEPQSRFSEYGFEAPAYDIGDLLLASLLALKANRLDNRFGLEKSFLLFSCLSQRLSCSFQGRLGGLEFTDLF
jgi:hypothetical protein